MSRYIDADKFTERIKASPAFCNMGQDGYFLQEVVLQILEKFPTANPTADVVEVRHGHWIEHTAKPDWLEDDVEVFYNCSECGTSHWSITPPFCPNCGAKMDGERSEECGG